MSGSIARELVLPALRLDVPSRPTREHLAVGTRSFAVDASGTAQER